MAHGRVADMSDDARLARAAARRRRPEDFPIRKFGMAGEPLVDGRGATTVDERVQECLRLSQRMFELSGEPYPTYRRAEMPGRVFRGPR